MNLFNVCNHKNAPSPPSPIMMITQVSLNSFATINGTFTSQIAEFSFNINSTEAINENAKAVT